MLTHASVALAVLTSIARCRRVTSMLSCHQHGERIQPTTPPPPADRACCVSRSSGNCHERVRCLVLLSRLGVRPRVLRVRFHVLVGVFFACVSMSHDLCVLLWASVSSCFDCACCVFVCVICTCVCLFVMSDCLRTRAHVLCVCRFCVCDFVVCCCFSASVDGSQEYEPTRHFLSHEKTTDYSRNIPWVFINPPQCCVLFHGMCHGMNQQASLSLFEQTTEYSRNIPTNHL